MDGNRIVEIIGLLFSGLGTNLLMTVGAVIVPLAIGVGLTFAMKAIKSSGARAALRIVGVLFYCIPVFLLLLFNFYVIGIQLGREFQIPIVIISLSISHLGYFLIHFDANASAGKNIAVNSLGLISSVFLWSMGASFIGVQELVRTATMIGTGRFDYTVPYLIALIMAFIVLAVLNIPRMILKETMK